MKFRHLIAALFCLLLLSGTARAVSYPVVWEVDAIQQASGSPPGTYLHNSTPPPSTTAIHLSAYNCGSSGPPCAPDGGGGLLIFKSGVKCKYAGQPSPPPSAILEDGGSFFADSGNGCWYRQNLNGDLRQWGLTKGSVYDAGMTPTALPVGSGGIVNAAITALAAAGINVVHTGQVSLYLDRNIKLNPGSSFTCDSPPVGDAANSSFANLPGSLVLGLGVSVDAYDNGKDNDVEIHDCAAILPEWYIDPANITGGLIARSGTTISAYPDMEAIRTNMILAHDTAIRAGAGAKIHDLAILGFDNCVNARNAPRLIVKNLLLDCSIGLYLLNQNGGQTAKDVFVNSYLTKSPPSGIAAEEYWSVSSVAPSAMGLCELKIIALKGQFNLMTGLYSPLFSVASLNPSTFNASPLRADPNYYPAWVTGSVQAPVPVPLSCLSASTGQFGNDPAWGFTITAHPDPGDYTDDYATVDLVGSQYTDTTSNFVSTTATWTANNGVIHISGLINNLMPGMTVTSTSGMGWPTSATVAGIVQRCTGPDPNDGYNGCVVVSPAPTVTSGGGLKFNSPALQTTPPLPLCNGTGQTPCFFVNVGKRYVSGASDAGMDIARLPASRGGSLGAGFFTDNIAGLRAINTVSFAHYYNIATIDSATCDFFEEKGDDQGEINTGNTIGIYTAGLSRGCVFEAHGPGKPAIALVQDTYGSSDFTDTSSSTGPVPQRSTSGFGAAPATTITVTGSNTHWPSPGTMHICNATTMSGTTLSCDPSASGYAEEYAFYTTLGTNQFVLNFRGQLGTKATDFSAGTVPWVFSTSVNSGSIRHADKSAATIFSDLDPSTTPVVGNQFEILHGSATIRNVDTLAGGIGFVSTNAAGVTIMGSNLLNTAIVFEDDSARAVTTVTPDSTFATYVKPGEILLPLSYGQYFGSSQALSIPMSGAPIGATYLGQLNVQDTTNWPQTGVVQVDAEYMAFHILDANSIIIDERGLCGSTANSHAASSMASYMNVLWGCPLLTPSVPQFAMDGSGNVSFAQSILAHGQVYMSLTSTILGPSIQLCPSGGKGLIISGVMRTVPSPCTYVPNSSAVANMVYYVYAVYHQVAVTSIVGFGSPPHVRLFVTDNTDFYQGMPITCTGITGTSGANVFEYTGTQPGSLSGNPYIDFPTILTTGSPAGTGACSYIGLEFDTNAHTTDPFGVEVDSAMGGGAKTLVGMAATDGSSTINDVLTKRDVASWFNRQPKKMLVSSTNTAQTNKASYHTPMVHAVEGEFVALGTPGRSPSTAPSAVQWSILAGATSSASGGANSGIAACFSPTSLGTNALCPSTPGIEPEVSPILPVGSSNVLFQVSGATNNLLEGRNFMDLLIQTSTPILSLATTGTSIDAYVMQ